MVGFLQCTQYIVHHKDHCRVVYLVKNILPFCGPVLAEHVLLLVPGVPQQHHLHHQHGTIEK